MQTLHGSPPSHNNTTPSPLAATQLLPPSRRRGSSCYPRLHHCSFPRSFPPTLLPPSHHLFSGCAAYDSPRTLSKVKLASFYLPPSSPSSLLEFLRLAPYRTAYFLPLFYSPLFLPPAFFLFPFLFRVPVISLSYPRCFFLLIVIVVDVVAVVIVAVAGLTKPPPPLDATAGINEKHTSK